jgi:hypothetical protein
VAKTKTPHSEKAAYKAAAAKIGRRKKLVSHPFGD